MTRTNGVLTVGKLLFGFLCAFFRALGPPTSSLRDEPYSVFNQYDHERRFK